LHYKLDVRGGLEAGGSSLAIVDLFRFEGTCIVEHWDALQQITGDEVNPNAFF
jgi:predicted SnoaL-like aldol condensation-catalyzing enzyme